jgi:hypothetical protein
MQTTALPEPKGRPHGKEVNQAPAKDGTRAPFQLFLVHDLARNADRGDVDERYRLASKRPALPRFMSSLFGSVPLARRFIESLSASWERSRLSLSVASPTVDHRGRLGGPFARQTGSASIVCSVLGMEQRMFLSSLQCSR